MAVSADQMKELLIDTFDLEFSPGEISLDMAIIDDGLELDSVDTLEILVSVEKKFGIKVPNDQIGGDSFSSVGALIDFVNKFA